MKKLLLENIIALRKTVIYSVVFFILSFIFSFIGSQYFLYYFSAPLIKLIQKTDIQLIYSNLIEPFAVRMNLASLIAIFLSIPFVIWQVCLFVMPGLYKKEKRTILPYLIISPVLFVAGGLFVYYFIFPNAWQFFLKFAPHKTDNLDIKLMIIVSDYLNLCIKMILLFGLAFQFPLILNLMLQLKLITMASLKKARRFVIVAIFILSAILTPPDILSQIMLAIPLIIMYELVILIGLRVAHYR